MPAAPFSGIFWELFLTLGILLELCSEARYRVTQHQLLATTASMPASAVDRLTKPITSTKDIAGPSDTARDPAAASSYHCI